MYQNVNLSCEERMFWFKIFFRDFFRQFHRIQAICKEITLFFTLILFILNLGPPVIVTVGLWVLSIDSINVVDMVSLSIIQYLCVCAKHSRPQCEYTYKRHSGPRSIGGSLFTRFPSLP